MFNLIFSAQGVEVKSNDTRFSSQKCMHWDKITEASTGNYTCKAKNRETGENETISYALHAIHLNKPTIIESNFDNEAVWKSELHDKFNLTCDFSGVPRPKLNWYIYEKNERKALDFSDHDHISLENNGKTIRFKFVKKDDQGKYECEAKHGQFSDQRSVTIEISK